MPREPYGRERGSMPIVAIRTVLADDNDTVRAALTEELDSGEVQVVGVASTGDEVLSLAESLQPDVIVLDLSMPGGGFSLIERLSQLAHSPRVLVFTGRDDVATVLSTLQAGAAGFVAKADLDGDFRSCVRRCAEGAFLVMARCGQEVRRQLMAKPVAHLAERGKAPMH